MRFETASVDGRAVQYLQSGRADAARALVMVHGFALGAKMWEPQIKAFERAMPDASWRLIAPALPGHDGSERVPEPSIESYARQMLELLDHLGLNRPVLGGLSMGGYVAFGMLRRAPQRFDALILADTRSTADNEETRAMRLKTMDVARREGPGAVADDQLPRLLGATTRSRRPDIVAGVRRLIEAQPPEGIADAAQAMMTRSDSGPLLPTIRVPTLVVVGAEDLITPPSAAEAMRAVIPNASLVTIPDAGHLANLENPEAFNDALFAFLRS
jgi:pimeloyl-ACP methyl ester carboxylesterase